MSTLNEIAANHATMAKAQEEESMEVCDRKTQVVGGFDVGSGDGSQRVLHFIAGVQDGQLGHFADYAR